MCRPGAIVVDGKKEEEAGQWRHGPMGPEWMDGLFQKTIEKYSGAVSDCSAYWIVAFSVWPAAVSCLPAMVTR